MNKYLVKVASCLLLVSAPTVTLAQQKFDESEGAQKLRECVMLQTSGRDRITVMRWMIAAFAVAPQVQDIVTMDLSKKPEIDKDMAKLSTRLMTVDCASEAKPLFQANATSAFEIAFAKMGEVAVTELLINKDASDALEDYAEYLNSDDFVVLKN